MRSTRSGGTGNIGFAFLGVALECHGFIVFVAAALGQAFLLGL